MNKDSLTLVCDLDGVVWQGDATIWPIVESLERFVIAGNSVVFCTNNSFTSPVRIASRLTDILSFPIRLVSTLTVASHRVEWRGKRVCVLGSDALKSSVLETGADFAGLRNKDVDVVLVGLDKTFSYEVLDSICGLIRGGADFYGANWDRRYPTSTSWLSPGCGALLAAIQHCTGVDPVILGKPSALMAEEVKHAADDSRILAVLGDSLEQDGALATYLDVPFIQVENHHLSSGVHFELNQQP